MLTIDIYERIIRSLEDARDIANLRCVCKAFHEVGKNIVSIRYVCRMKDYEDARGKIHAIALGNDLDENLRDAGTGSSKLGDRDVVAHQGQASSDQFFKATVDNSNSSRSEPGFIPFRRVVEHDLATKSNIAQLRIEIEPKLQSKSAPDERRNNDFWLSDPAHLLVWVPSVAHSLEHLCIVDYGHQAIGRESPILKILSQYCNNLKTIDLRNMWIDTKKCAEMPEITSFTLRCVKLNDDALNDISDKLKNLKTLALLGVLGIKNGDLKLQRLTVLCLGLSTKANKVGIELPNLLKLQLKMACPDEMSINAPALKYVAFNLEVRDCLALKFEQISNLQELLYGSSKFVALSGLVKGNQSLSKVFLDIPCMALGEDGRWLGVLREVPLYIPSFKILSVECPNLEVLNIGPGLWHSMEFNIDIVKNTESWPQVQTLILQIIPNTVETSATVLKTLVTEMHLRLVNLEIYVHSSCPVNSDELLEVIAPDVQHLNFHPKRWTKSLDFSCFTF